MPVTLPVTFWQHLRGLTEDLAAYRQLKDGVNWGPLPAGNDALVQRINLSLDAIYTLLGKPIPPFRLSAQDRIDLENGRALRELVARCR